MSSMFVQFREFLDRQDLRYTEDAENGVFTLSFGGKHSSSRIVVLVESSLLQIWSTGGVKIPEGSRTEVAVAVARSNFGLRLGKFETNLEDGELRYQVALPFEKELPEDIILERVLYVGLAMLDKYLAAFLSIVYGNETAKDAIALVEA